LLVEERAIEQAEQECLADNEVRARRREGETAQAELDEKFVRRFAVRVHQLFLYRTAGQEIILA